jgi:hypothetical protein
MMEKSEMFKDCTGVEIRDLRSKSELSAGLDARLKRVEAAKGKLIFQAARCLTVLPLSEYSEDWPGNIPKVVLREIEKQTERLKDMAVRLREIADSI